MKNRFFISFGVLALTASAYAQVVSGPGKTPIPTDIENVRVFPVSTESYDAVRNWNVWELSGVALPDGSVRTLDLTRFDPIAPDATLVLSTDGGEFGAGRPAVAMFRGFVREEGTRAFLSVSQFGVYGLLVSGDRDYIISSGPMGQGRPTLVYAPSTLPLGMIRWKEFACGNDGTLRPPNSGGPPGEGGIAGADQCRSADIAVETDYEFTQTLFGGDTTAANAYIATLMGAVSEIYERDLNIELVVTFTRLWTTSGDPWTQTDTTNQLFEFQDYWNLNMTGETRHLAHFLSGRGLGGGVAYLDALCFPEYDYGLSANLDGFFPYPIQNNNAQNWDLMVTAHELGHNFGAPHTHDHTPQIDDCAGGDCSVVPNGTIMSYCHLCSGGLANVRMEFHARSIYEEMVPFMDTEAPCNIVIGGADISDQPDNASACEGGSVSFSVTANAPDPPISFQWRRNAVNLSNGGNISGATTATLTVNPIAAGDAGSYDCVLSTSLCASVTTAIATLTVNGASASLPFSETWPNTSFDSSKWSTQLGAPTIDTAGPTEPSAPNSLHLELTDGVESACMNLSGVGSATFSYYWARSSTEAGDDLEVYYLNNVGTWVLLTTHLSGGNSASYTLASHNLPAAAQHSAFRIRFLASCSSTGDEWFVDNINVDAACTAPSVSSHPSNQTVCSGGSASFSVTASGTAPLSYQWRKNTVNIGGATSSSYNINPVAPGDAGSYDCVVTNACGSATSNAATLTVNTAPSISSHPSNQTVCSGGSASFSVTASGTAPLSYQWRKNTVNIGGATSSSYNINPVAPGDAGSYDCVVTNACGSATSNSATLTVNTAPSISSHPSNQTVCNGGSASFSVTASGTAPLSYQWRKNTVNIGGATSSSYNINPVAPGDAGSYDCVVTNACGSATSNAATLTVNTAPSISSHPSSQTVCEGDSASFSVTASGTAPLSYQWRKNTVNIGGATSSSYNINPVAPGDAGSYDCVVTNACGSATSNAATLTVNTAPSISSHPSSQSVNVGDPVSFSVTASGTAPLSYQWRKGGIDIGGATSSTYNIASAALADAGVYDCVVTNACGSIDSDDATLTVTAPCDPCDTNCDGSINPFDIQPFLEILGGSLSPCSPCAADTNGNGTINPFDINDFLACLS